MKKPIRLFSSFLAACIVAVSFPHVGFAAEGNGTTHTVPDGGIVSDLLAQDQVTDGDTIQITGTGHVKTPETDHGDTPWVIDKNVTIADGTLDIQTGGIVLGADVTFRNISLSFTSNMRNAIIANGHTLTLENVTCGNHSFNLFCGGLINSNNEPFSTEIPAPGGVGIIRIKGSTSLQNRNTFGSGNIYAGNLCMGGTNEQTNGADDNGLPNGYMGDAEIIIEGSGDVGDVHACGAQQRIPVNQPNGKVTLPDPENYTVSGIVMVSGRVPDVVDVGANEAKVVYQGAGDQTLRLFQGITSLSVESGYLALRNGSSLQGEQHLSVAAGAKLELSPMRGWSNLDVQHFSGNGCLILDEQQIWVLDGTVEGLTTVSIGPPRPSGDSFVSTDIPLAGHTYIHAPHSAGGNFQLLPPANDLSMTLVLDGSGNWTVPAKEEEDSRVQGLKPEDVCVSSGTKEAHLPLNPTYSGEALYLYSLPLTVWVNERKAEFHAENEYYEAAGLCIYVGMGGEEDEEGQEELQLLAASSFDDPIPDNVYRIEIVVPGEYTVSGEELSAYCTLTVGSIPVPQENIGLTWTGAEQTGVNEGAGYTLTGHKASDAGDYTAIAVLASGCQWTDGTQENKSIPWHIAKSTTPPAAPGGLAGIAPASAGGTDGRITGTTVEMEYSDSSDFAASRDCGAGEVYGLSTGTYYVRLKENGNHVAGAAAEVIVPAFDAPRVTAISIQTPADKTGYQVGEPLDTAGLTIRADYSDGTFQTVDVTGNMVEGFDSSQAAERQILTIHYAGQTASYEIRITEPDIPFPEHQHHWSADWSTNADYHWHSCTAEGCPIQENSRKDGYAAHTAGEWVIDLAADAAHSGSRHKSCTVCGYEMAREEIPATGGSSSSSTNTVTNTVKNPDGSITTTTTNRTTGTVKTTTRNTDGSTVTVETKKNGTITTTEKAADGSTVKTTANPDGSSLTTVTRSDGTTASVSTDSKGKTEARISLSEEAVRTAQKDNEAVSLPIPAVNAAGDGGNASAVEIALPGSLGAVRLEIPVGNAAPGVVAVIVNPDGSESVVKKSAVTGQGIALTLNGAATVKIMNNSTVFSDVSASDWVSDAVDFVSARGILQGTGGGAFSPDSSMTRGMLAMALYNLEDSPAYTSGSNFTDVGDAWYTDAVHWTAEQGIISGYGDGRYGPNDTITREQLAVMLWRYAGSPAAADRELRFADADSASGYALEALLWARENGIINGNGSGQLMPQGLATRAQAAQMLMNFMGKQQ